MGKTANSRFTTLDIYLAAFLLLYGIKPDLELLNGRVIFSFPATGQLYEGVMIYNAGSEVRVTEFVTAVKMLRGQMLTLRDRKIV